MVFTTPDQSPGEQYALSACLSILATSMAALRFYAVKVRKDKYWFDDLFIVIALIGTWAIAIVNIIGAAAGDEGQHTELDEHGQPVMTERYVVFLKAIYANQLVQLWAVGPTKISVLLFYRRIFVGNIFNIVTWIMLVLVSCWTVTFFFTNLLECIPIDHAWQHVVGGYPDPKCFNAVDMYLAQAYMDVIFDFIILTIPIPLIWNLNMPLRRRLAVLSIFLVGIMTIGASVAKLVVQMFIGTEITKEMDISYFLTPIMYWPMIEAALGITAACLPTMRCLFTEGAGVNKFYHHVCSSISNGISTVVYATAGKRSRSSASSWMSKESDMGHMAEIAQGYRGQSVVSCHNQNIARCESRVDNEGKDHEHPLDGVVIEREFSVKTSVPKKTLAPPR